MLLESLLYDSSRAAIIDAVKVIEGKPELFEKMLELCTQPYPVAMRAARVVQIYCIKYPDTILPHLKILTDELLTTKVDGVKRSFLKIMIEAIDIKYIYNAGLVFNKCLDWLFSEKETIAVRAYSLDLVVKFVKKEPDLKNEMMLVLENVPLDDFPSLEIRIRRYLKKF